MHVPLRRADVLMCAMSPRRVRCIESPDKPLEAMSAAERAAFSAPSVEDHLNAIRRALATAASIAICADELPDLLDEPQIEDVNRTVHRLCCEAWKLAEQLTEGLPGRVQKI